MTNPVKEHYLPRNAEIFFGFVFAIIGIWLIWSAFDNRGKDLPWPLSGFMPV